MLLIYSFMLNVTQKNSNYIVYYFRTGQARTAGTGCNQAIMLVTDGVPYKFETIFQVNINNIEI